MVVFVVKIVGLDKDYETKKATGKFTKQQLKEFFKEYEEERAELKSRLSIFTGLFMNKKRGLKMADGDPSEELKKLSESMEVDFDELRANFLT